MWVSMLVCFAESLDGVLNRGHIFWGILKFNNNDYVFIFEMHVYMIMYIHVYCWFHASSFSQLLIQFTHLAKSYFLGSFSSLGYVFN